MPKESLTLEKPKTTETPPVLVVGLGRGSVGKSTCLAELVWRAQAAGRDPIVADFDPKSRTLSMMFPGAATPATEETADMKEAMTGLLNQMVSTRRSAVLDLGTGERALVEYGRDMPLVKFCERRGIEPVALFVMGPDDEDWRHVESIWKTGAFNPSRVILALNEGVVKGGMTVAGAFNRTINQPGFKAMMEAGAKFLLVQRLAAMAAAKETGASFYDIAIGKVAQDPVTEFMTETWLGDMEARRLQAKVTEWLP
ncbi:MAG: uncharacterized protein JWP29_1985 [Rhodoferax sp.]|nr:uncharacterized protein [Rhodoferax sp.]